MQRRLLNVVCVRRANPSYMSKRWLTLCVYFWLRTKVPQLLRSLERKFHVIFYESLKHFCSRQRKFHRWNFRSRERKFFRESESSCYCDIHNTLCRRKNIPFLLCYATQSAVMRLHVVCLSVRHQKGKNAIIFVVNAKIISCLLLVIKPHIFAYLLSIPNAPAIHKILTVL